MQAVFTLCFLLPAAGAMALFSAVLYLHFYRLHAWPAWPELSRAMDLEDPRPGQELHSFAQIYTWWEQRRLVFNLAVGGLGFLASLPLFQFAAVLSLKRQDLALSMLCAACAYGLGANLCYSLGWAAEALLQRYTRLDSNAWGRRSYAWGFGFSLLLTLLLPLGFLFFGHFSFIPHRLR
jgi:hypothetical protein